MLEKFQGASFIFNFLCSYNFLAQTVKVGLIGGRNYFFILNLVFLGLGFLVVFREGDQRGPCLFFPFSILLRTKKKELVGGFREGVFPRVWEKGKKERLKLPNFWLIFGRFVKFRGNSRFLWSGN